MVKTKKPTVKKPVMKKDDGVFHYFDGTHNRGIDVMELSIALADKSEVLMETITVLQSKEGTVPTKMILEATKTLVATFRDVLNIPAYEEIDGVKKGLPAGELLKIASNYMQYMATVKKNIKP